MTSRTRRIEARRQLRAAQREQFFAAPYIDDILGVSLPWPVKTWEAGAVLTAAVGVPAIAGPVIYPFLPVPFIVSFLVLALLGAAAVLCLVYPGKTAATTRRLRLRHARETYPLPGGSRR